MTADEASKDSQRYIFTWRRIIVDFLGRTETEVEDLVNKWRGWFGNEWFYHEPPEYYVSWKLVPESVARSLPLHERMSLSWALQSVVGRYDRECELAPECFDAMRQELNRTLDEWVRKSKRGPIRGRG